MRVDAEGNRALFGFPSLLWARLRVHRDATAHALWRSPEAPEASLKQRYTLTMVLILFLTILSGSPLMQEDYSKLCKDWKNKSEIRQTEMTICAAEEAKAAEAELERRYQDLLTGVRQLRSDVGTTELDMSRAIKNINAAQSAWVRYRDAYINATFPLENKQQEYGTMYSMRVSGIRADMAREQIRHIKTLCENSVAEWLWPKYCGTR